MTEEIIHLNENSVNCIRSSSQWTKTVYYNICNGATYDVPSGTVDYIAGGLLIALGLGVVLVVFAFLGWCIWGKPI